MSVPYEEHFPTGRRVPRRQRVRLVTIRYGELRVGDVAREHPHGDYSTGWGFVDGVYTAARLQDVPAQERDRFVNAEPGTVIMQWRSRPFIRLEFGKLVRGRSSNAGPVWTFSAHNALDLLEVQFLEDFYPYPSLVDVDLPLGHEEDEFDDDE